MDEKFEFENYQDNTPVDDENEISEQLERSMKITDFIEYDCKSSNKKMKKAIKSLKKAAKKSGKRMKKLSSEHEDLKQEVSALKNGFVQLKQEQYNNKLFEMAMCNDASERIHLVKKIINMEVPK